MEKPELDSDRSVQQEDVTAAVEAPVKMMVLRLDLPHSSMK